MDCSLLDSSVHGIPRQEYRSGLTCPPPGDLSNPRIEPAPLTSRALTGRFFTTSATWEAWKLLLTYICCTVGTLSLASEVLGHSEEAEEGIRPPSTRWWPWLPASFILSVFVEWKVKVKVAELCPALCDTMDYIVHGILQVRILEWVAFPFSRGSSHRRDWTQVSCIAGRFFTNWAIREALVNPSPMHVVCV